MRAGSLRHRVVIQQRSTSQDSFGGQVDTWTDVATISASVEPLTGRELLTAQATQNETTGKVRMRYNATVTAAHRFMFKGRVLSITSHPLHDAKLRETVVFFSEGLSNG